MGLKIRIKLDSTEWLATHAQSQTCTNWFVQVFLPCVVVVCPKSLPNYDILYKLSQFDAVRKFGRSGVKLAISCHVLIS